MPNTKTYSKIKLSNKSYVYRVKDGRNTFRLNYAFNTISETYMGTELVVFDDNWQYIKRNAWILDIEHYDIDKSLKVQGFQEVKSTELEIAIAEI